MYLKDQVTDEGFKNFTTSFLEMAYGAVNQSETLINATVAAENFLANIDSSGYEDTDNLVGNLAGSMILVSYTVDCFAKKINTLTYIYKVNAIKMLIQYS